MAKVPEKIPEDNDSEIQALKDLIYKEDVLSETFDSLICNKIIELETISGERLQDLYLTQEDVDSIAQVINKECYLIECQEQSKVEYSVFECDPEEPENVGFNENLCIISIDSYNNDDNIYKLNPKNNH